MSTLKMKNICPRDTPSLNYFGSSINPLNFEVHEVESMTLNVVENEEPMVSLDQDLCAWMKLGWDNTIF
jgi:hypothetical protein